MREDRIAFLLLFCGMVLVKRRKASLAETMSMLPLHGKGRLLAIEINRDVAQEPGALLYAVPGDRNFYPEAPQT